MGHSPTPNEVGKTLNHIKAKVNEEPEYFDILRYNNPDDLIAVVNMKLHDGWKLHSMVHVIYDEATKSYNYWQAITR